MKGPTNQRVSHTSGAAIVSAERLAAVVATRSGAERRLRAVANPRIVAAGARAGTNGPVGEPRGRSARTSASPLPAGSGQLGVFTRGYAPNISPWACPALEGESSSPRARRTARLLK